MVGIRLFPPRLSVSQQATKGPIYTVLLSLLTARHRPFVADCVTIVQHSLLSSIREGNVISSLLRVGFLLLCSPFQFRFLVLLSIFDVVDASSIRQSFQLLLESIQSTHNALLIRLFSSTLLYVPFWLLIHCRSTRSSSPTKTRSASTSSSTSPTPSTPTWSRTTASPRPSPPSPAAS